MTRLVLALVPAMLLATAAVAQKVEWWSKDFDSALAAAKEKPAGLLLLYCWQDQHDQCTAMFSGTLSDAKTEAPLGELVCMGAKDDDAGRPLLQRYGITRVPTCLLLDPEGKVVDVIPGYAPVEQFLSELKRIRAGTDTLASLREQVAAKPDDLALALRLVQKLRSAGDLAGSVATIDAMIAADPKQKSEAAAEAMLLKITDETFAPEIKPADYDLGPLRRFLQKQKNKRIQFLGYDRMAAAEWKRGDLKAAAQSAEKAWKVIPDDQLVDWGQNVAGLAYQNWQDLDKADKGILKKALQLSDEVLKAVQKRHEKSPDNAFLGNAMYLHAAVLIVNKKRGEALDLMDEAMKVDPKNENLKKAKDRWLDGSK